MRLFLHCVFVLLVAVAFSRCAHQGSAPEAPPVAAPAPAPAPDVPAALPEKCSTVNGKTSCEWTAAHDAFIRARVTPLMVSTDPGVLCPKYRQLADKLAFWAALFKSTSWHESRHWRLAEYAEKFPDHTTGKRSVSTGLFQLSQGDATIYKNEACRDLTPERLHSQDVNAACAVYIADTLIAGRAPFKKVADVRASLGRYWSTIRDGVIDGTLRKEIPSCF